MTDVYKYISDTKFYNVINNCHFNKQYFLHGASCIVSKSDINVLCFLLQQSVHLFLVLTSHVIKTKIVTIQ